MENNSCLKCYEPLLSGETDYHQKCAKSFFGDEGGTTLPYTLDSLNAIGVKLLRSKTAIQGVQPKFSFDWEKSSPNKSRLTFVGYRGTFIVKPSHPEYKFLPELEDLTMHLAEMLSIETASHSLIRFQDGGLAYITKRFDRISTKKAIIKLHQEDMAQLTERLSEDKYKGSIEKIGDVIFRYSNSPGLDAIRFMELLLFCFVTGNSDMHLKNFSLLITKEKGISLSPAYDLLPTVLIAPEDKEELALTCNGKKHKITFDDFLKAAKRWKITDKTMKAIIEKFNLKLPLLNEKIDKSFLNPQTKNAYKDLLVTRLARLS